MNEEEQTIEDKSTDKSKHIQVQTCQCSECQAKRRYRQYIIDEDAFVANLNDWD